MEYKGWLIELHEDYPEAGKFQACDPNGDYPTKFGDSVDAIIEEIDDES